MLSYAGSRWNYERGGEGTAGADPYRFRDPGKGHRNNLMGLKPNSAHCYLSAHRRFRGIDGDASNGVGLRPDVVNH
ncbi:MAG: hypothetical protein DDT34_02462 [Firmicutes bacterium]|nr:hypothetical protein [Bacillota bacterium]